MQALIDGGIDRYGELLLHTTLQYVYYTC